MEEIPEGTAISAQVQEKLATYRSNYAAISDRLIAEQAAAEKLQTAQTLAWQAAVTVQNPPHPLKIWQRASRKWQEAIALLETIPPTTATYERSQEKLTIYRRNYTSINQRITTETEALRTLKQFSEIATQLNHLPTTATTNQTNDQIGISHEKYVGLVQTLETSLGQFSRQPEATKHTIYPSLMQAIDDYQQTLKLWQAYLDYKEENAQWLSGDIFNQIFPVSPDEIALLVQKYGIGTYSDGTKISLRFSAWAIWQQANQHVNKAQRKILNSN